MPAPADRAVPSCKESSSGAICECELLYLAAINGELMACNDRVRSLYRELAAYYLRSCEWHCLRHH